MKHNRSNAPRVRLVYWCQRCRRQVILGQPVAGEPLPQCFICRQDLQLVNERLDQSRPRSY